MSSVPVSLLGVNALDEVIVALVRNMAKIFGRLQDSVSNQVDQSHGNSSSDTNGLVGLCKPRDDSLLIDLNGPLQRCL